MCLSPYFTCFAIIIQVTILQKPWAANLFPSILWLGQDWVTSALLLWDQTPWQDLELASYSPHNE